MADASTLDRPKAIPLTDKIHDYVQDLLGKDPRAAQAQVDPSLPTGTPIVAAVPMTPDAARADLERRLKVSGPIYAKNGPAADLMVPEKDRLTPAELKIGNVTVERGRDTSLDGKDSVTTVSDKGVTTRTTATVTANTIGADGKVDEFSREQSKSTTIGVGTASQTQASKTTSSSGGLTTVDANQTTHGVDLIAGTASKTTGTSSDVTDANTGTKTTTSDRTTTTVGMTGVTQTHDTSTQVGKQLDSTSVNGGIQRADGQLGIGGGATVKSGTMKGPAETQVMDKGTEVTAKGSGGLVSDANGTGVGLNASAGSKAALGHGVSLSNTIGGGGKCQSIVAEVPGSDPVMFSITTTISFDASIGVGASGEYTPTANEATSGKGDNKGSISIGATASVAASASFKRQLGAEAAKTYLDSIQQNGRGGTLPEHKILATGMSEGWGAARQLWQSLSGSTAQAKTLKPGEELTTSKSLSAGAKLGVNGGEDREGGLAVGGSVSRTDSRTVTVKKAGMPDGRIQVTATVIDQKDEAANATVSMGVASGGAGVTHGEGHARAVVFTLDPKSPDFDKILGAINAATSAAQIDDIAKRNHALLTSTTTADSASDGGSASLSVAGVGVELGGKGTIANQVTRDKDGNITDSLSVGTSQTGGKFGAGELKVGDSKTDSYAGAVHDGKASGEIGSQSTSTSMGKTLQNLGDVGKDPLGAVLHPGKLLADATNTEGTAVADPQIMGICAEALNKSKWNSKVGGHRMDEWKATGDKIRAAITLKDGEIVAVDKTAVQRALAEWSKGDDGGRTEVLDSLIRPLGGVPTGKAFAFPDGTESYKPQWDALVIADPLDGARAKVKEHPQDALKDMQAVQQQVTSLRNGIQTASAKWVGYETQLAEMLGHINTRVGEIAKAVQELTRALAKAAKPKPVDPAPVIGPPTQEQAQAKDEADHQRADDVRAQLDTYNNNIAQMKTYSDAVFGILFKAEARMKDDGFFSDNAITRLLDAGKMVKQAEDEIKLWDGLYWPTYSMYEAISKSVTGLDKSRLEKLHVAGAKARCKQVYDMTRDTSMAGRM